MLTIFFLLTKYRTAEVEKDSLSKKQEHNVVLQNSEEDKTKNVQELPVSQKVASFAKVQPMLAFKREDIKKSIISWIDFLHVLVEFRIGIENNLIPAQHNSCDADVIEKHLKIIQNNAMNGFVPSDEH